MTVFFFFFFQLSSGSRTNKNDINSPRTSGYGSSASVTSYGVTSSSPTPLTDRVSITTVDEYNLFIDPSFYFVTLRKQKQITRCSKYNKNLRYIKSDIIHTTRNWFLIKSS